ncbi:hypothetical protein JCM17960_08410 [Magnetospira thiophila]
MERAFREGRTQTKARESSLKEQLDRMAPIMRASNLGRVPTITARILRRLAREGILGRDLIVIGTTSLYAYEARAGVHIGGDFVATKDVDLLFDARRGLKFCSAEMKREGLLRALQRVDRSFQGSGYQASNDKGFYVDLVRPQVRNKITTHPVDRIADDDLAAAPVAGLDWLLNVPKFTQIAVGEDGMPVPIVAVDPRAFALHKKWLASRPDRDPLKKARDHGQGEVAAALAQDYFGMVMDDPTLNALPAALRSLA